MDSGLWTIDHWPLLIITVSTQWLSTWHMVMCQVSMEIRIFGNWQFWLLWLNFGSTTWFTGLNKVGCCSNSVLLKCPFEVWGPKIQTQTQTDQLSVQSPCSLLKENQDFIIIVIGTCENFSSWCSSCSCHEQPETKTGNARRRAIDKTIRASARAQPKKFVSAAPTPSKLLNCTMQGRRAPEFASGVFDEVCEKVSWQKLAILNFEFKF